MNKKHIFIVITLSLIFLFACSTSVFAISWLVSQPANTSDAAAELVSPQVHSYEYITSGGVYGWNLYAYADTPYSHDIYVYALQSGNTYSISVCSPDDSGYGLYAPGYWNPTNGSPQYYWVKYNIRAGTPYTVIQGEDTYTMYNVGIFNSDTAGGLEVFTSVQDACDYYCNYVPEPEVVNLLQYEIPRGNVAYIDFGAAGLWYHINIYSEFAGYSGKTLGGTRYWPYDNRLYFWSNSLPADDDITTFNSGTLIPWEKTGKTNIFGQTKSGKFSLGGESNSTAPARYLVIVNPNTFLNNQDKQVTNMSVRIAAAGVPSGNSVHIYALRESLALYDDNEDFTGFHLVNDYNPENQTSYTVTVEYDQTSGASSTTTVDNNTGEPSNVEVGGDNTHLDIPSIDEYVEGLNGTLDSFTNQVLEFLKAPLSHIQNLIDEGSDFMHSVAAMFTWLPEPVQIVIGSGLILLIVIGVLKLLL